MLWRAKKEKHMERCDVLRAYGSYQLMKALAGARSGNKITPEDVLKILKFLPDPFQENGFSIEEITYVCNHLFEGPIHFTWIIQAPHRAEECGKVVLLENGRWKLAPCSESKE
jgi:hypothetical protein